MKLIPIAEIVSAHGIKGAVKVYLYNTEDPLLCKIQSVYMGNEKENRLMRLRKIRKIDKRFCIVNFEGIVIRKDAEALKGMKLLVTPEMLPPLPEGYVYLSLLIDYFVFDDVGKEIGVVEDFINNGIQDIMVVRHINGSEVLIPYVDEFIKKIDEDKKQIIIKPMEGLIE
jgi:16S rRNA processing protein RimM